MRSNRTPCLYSWLIPPVFVAVLAAAGCSRTPATVTATKPDDPLSVTAIQVQPEQVHRRIEVVGTLAGNQEVTISSEVAARVVAIHADLGDRVSKDQVLIELDPTQSQLTVERQEAALAEVLAQLGVKEEGDPLPELAATSTVRKAAAEAADAQSSYERAKALKAEGVIAPQAYDSAEARYRTGQAGYAAALESVRNLAAHVENLRAQLRLARQSLADTRIRASFDGTVRQRLVEVGQYVREQTPVISLASTNPLKLQAAVPERLFPYVQPGVRVEITVEAYPEEKFLGRVTRVAHASQTETRTFTFEARVDNQSGRLRPGLFARGILETSEIASIIRVPADAVISFYGVQKVYGIENGVIREKVIKLGDRFGEDIEVTEGLAAGDWIATDKLARLREGAPVRTESPSGRKS